ncbi:MAG: hypothetical protein VXX60_01465 [Bacteroidota bacterium]|nr:hypothetical protein [Bacteroidota bacterium]
MPDKHYLLFLSIGFFSLFYNCESVNKTENVATLQKNLQSSKGIENSEISVALLEVDPDAENVVAQWSGFEAVKMEIIKLKNGARFFANKSKKDISQLFKSLEDGIPESLDKNNIRARINVLETNCYINNSKIINIVDSIQILNKIFTSYSNLIHQINKTQEKSVQLYSGL